MDGLSWLAQFGDHLPESVRYILLALVGATGTSLLLLYREVLVALLRRLGRHSASLASRLWADRRFEARYLRLMVRWWEQLPGAGILPSPISRSPSLRELFVVPSLKAWQWEGDAAAEDIVRESTRGPYSARGEDRWTPVPFVQVFPRHRHLLLLGGPGSGKSTFLRFLALAHAQTRLGRGNDLWKQLGLPPDRSFPILLPLRDLIGQESSLPEQLEAHISRYLKPPQGFFHRRLQRGGCILLLDGLDEATGVGTRERERVRKSIETLLALYPRNCLLITSRSAGWRGGLPPDISVFSLAEFNRSQRETFIRNWYRAIGTDSLAEHLIETVEANDPLRRLASNPLLLSLIAWMHYEGVPLVAKRARLYRQCAEWMLARWDTERGIEDRIWDRFSPRSRGNVLAHLAWYLQERGTYSADRSTVEGVISQVLSEMGEEEADATQIVEWLERRTGLLVNGEQLAFVHQAFQEYFAAQMLVSDPEKRQWLLDGEPPPVLHPRWQEVARLYCGLAEDASEFIRALYSPERDDRLRRRLFLAGRCVAEAASVDPLLRKEIVGRLLWLWQEGPYRRWQEEAIAILSISPDPRIVRYFIRALTSDDPWMRWKAAEALGRLQVTSEEVMDALLKALQDENALVRTCAAVTLGELDAPEGAVAPLLFQAMEDDDPLVRGSAVGVLTGRLKREDLPLLLARISGEGAMWRGKVAEALGMLGSEENIDVLRQMLTDRSLWVRLKAAEALLRLGRVSEEILEVVKTYLIERGWVGREAAASLISLLPDQGETLITWLIQVAQSPDPERRGNALGALGMIGRTDREVIAALHRGMDDESREVRWKAAWSLSMLGRADSTVVKMLLSALADGKDWIARWKAAEALGVLDRAPDEVIDALIQALFDRDNWVRDAALESLWRLSERMNLWLSLERFAPRRAGKEEPVARIQVDPDQIRDFAYQMARAGREIADIRSRLAHVWTRLHAAGWEGSHRARVDGLWDKVQSQAGMLAEQAATLSRFLDERATTFQEAERVSMVALSQVTAEIETFSAATRNWVSGLLQRCTSFPREAVMRVLRFVEIFEERINWSALFGGLGLLSILRGLGVNNVPSPAATPALTLSGDSDQLPQQREDERKPLAEPHSRFGELLREWEEEKARVPPQPSPSPSVILPVYEVPVLKQRAKSYECGPTSVSMILQYYSKEHTTLTPQQIIQRLGQRFNPRKGIGADKLVDGLREMDLGYRTIEWTAGLDKEALLSELRQGPVIAQVHLNLGSSGYPHMVVVTGASEGGKVVHINDPWTGEARQLTWESFERTWTFSQYPQASHLIIRMRP